MTETIKIGGELESMATGNVVAAASAIKDKVKNKYQGEINAETDASLADRYTKAETYNKAELNNMITTPNQQYVSVTANSQTTAVTDVLPATGEANTVYRVGNWDGSQFDASVYSEYAWNGSQYVHLSTKTRVGEVFDISAYHATGGVLAKYADLAAALDSNNGGGVPQSLQRGGMEVKYVCTYDNKYVQYRLVDPNWSTDIYDWTSEDPYFIDKVMQEVNEAIDENTPIEITGDVTNAPDEEDLTSVNVGGTDVLKFKDKAYTPLTYSGMGRVYLRKNIVNGVNTLTQDMFYKGEVGSREPNTNTIFVIQYDYVIDSANDNTITVPANCVLEFDGGSLMGGTLTGQNTRIEGDAKLSNTVISGTFNNDFIDLSWFSVNSDVINEIGTLPYKLKLDKGEWSFDKPLVFANGDDLVLTAKMNFVGNNFKGSPCITVKDHIDKNIIIENVVCSVTPDYIIPSNTNTLGVLFINVYFNTIKINNIFGFNTCVKFLGDASIGTGRCASNFVYTNSIGHANKIVHLSQNRGGWCNENHFIGGYFQQVSSLPDTGEYWQFYLSGEGASDSYNKINGIILDGCIIEGALKTGLSVTKDGGGIYAKNANFCTFVNLRTERHNVPLKMVFNGSQFNVDRDVAFDKNYGEKKVDLKDYYYTGINRKYANIIQEFHGGFNSKESAFTISDHNYYYIVGDSSVRLRMVFTKDINGNDIPETNEGQAAQKPVFNFYINATRTFWQTAQNRTYWQFCIPEDVSECIVWAESGNLNIYKSDYELSL